MSHHVHRKCTVGHQSIHKTEQAAMLCTSILLVTTNLDIIHSINDILR